MVTNTAGMVNDRLPAVILRGNLYSLLCDSCPFLGIVIFVMICCYLSQAVCLSTSDPIVNSKRQFGYVIDLCILKN